MLFTEFVAEIENKCLFKKGDTVVAAVSGGADSVCLLHLMYRLRPIWDLKLFCAHVNHGLREEAEDDALFVEALCKKWEIPFLLHEENVGDRAKEKKVSIELAGREVRYAFFKSLDADVVLTAHNKNDAAESVLLHMLRGCGLDGLCGIPQKREDGICRPLLRFTREQIEAYLFENNLSWHEDTSNQDTLYTRNKIRHDILPHMQEINPAFLDAISRMTEILREENAYMHGQVKALSAMRKENNVMLFSVDRLLSIPLPLRRRMVQEAVANFFEANQVLELLQKRNGSMCKLSGGKVAEKEYGEIAIYAPSNALPTPEKLPMKGDLVFGEYRITVGNIGLALPKKEYILRTRQNGDIFCPEGMLGRKKIKDYFIDKKIPRRLRDVFPLITYDEKIAAVGDLRRSREFIPQNEDVLHIKITHI